MQLVKTSYKSKDVIILLKDLTGSIKEQSTEERERAIQSGVPYSEMLPIEYQPSPEYAALFEDSLVRMAAPIANAIANLCERIVDSRKSPVLVSLARAGIPTGILIKHFLKKKYRIDAPHYAVSIIRGQGIDKVAMGYLLERYPAEDLLFVDGWTGKGTIKRQLEEALEDYPEVSDELAVIADPAHLCKLAGTWEDFLIPSSCLNSTVSGLISRTVYRKDLIGPEDFHGAVYYGALAEYDVSYRFIDAIEAHFDEPVTKEKCKETGISGLEETESIRQQFGISDLNKVKPGIGEATRVLLRRLPWKVVVRDKSDPDVAHLLRLAEEKGVPVEEYPLINYKAVGLVKELSDI